MSLSKSAIWQPIFAYLTISINVGLFIVPVYISQTLITRWTTYNLVVSIHHHSDEDHSWLLVCNILLAKDIAYVHKMSMTVMNKHLKVQKLAPKC